MIPAKAYTPVLLIFSLERLCAIQANYKKENRPDLEVAFTY